MKYGICVGCCAQNALMIALLTGKMLLKQHCYNPQPPFPSLGKKLRYFEVIEEDWDSAEVHT